MARAGAGLRARRPVSPHLDLGILKTAVVSLFNYCVVSNWSFLTLPILCVLEKVVSDLTVSQLTH